MKRGRPARIDGVESQSKLKRVCAAQGCGLEIRGTNLGRHYKMNTNFQMLHELKLLSSEVAESTVKHKADPHTAYMFRNNHSMTNLPRWNTHKATKKPVPDAFKPKASIGEGSKDGHGDKDWEEGGGDGDRNGDGDGDEDAVSDGEGDDEDAVQDIEGIGDGEIDENSNDIPSKKHMSHVDGMEGDTSETKSEDKAGEEKLEDSELNPNLTDQIKKALKGFKSELTDEVIEQLSERIATKTAEKTVNLMKLEEAKKEMQAVKVDESWIEGDTMYSCRPCGVFSDSKDVPPGYAKYKRGHFGVVEKFKGDGEKRRKSHVVQCLKEHTENSLHIYCCIREKKEEQEEKDFEKRNDHAARINVRNVIKTLKRGGSSVDFVAENNIFHLEAEHQEMVVPVKNDSTASFFQTRDVVFEVVSEKTKAWFATGGKGGVEEIAVTLDKVTIQRVSYTALLTYFFYNGVIYVILNKLYTMRADEYDSEGTAKAAVGTLCETLGITR